MLKDHELFERKVLLKRSFSPLQLLRIGKSLKLPYFNQSLSRDLEEDRIAYEIASSLDDEALEEIFRKFPPWGWVTFRGSRYTLKDGKLQLKGSWDHLRSGLEGILERYGSKSSKVLRTFLQSSSNSIEALERSFAKFDIEGLTRDLEHSSLIAVSYRGGGTKEWYLPEELIPLIRDVLGEGGSELTYSLGPETRVATEQTSKPKSDETVAEINLVQNMDAQFNQFLSDLLKNRLDETISFGKEFSAQKLTEYLSSLFGRVIYFDSFLSLIQQYSLSEAEILTSTGKKSGKRTGFNLALFGEPGTGKSYPTRDLILGTRDGSVPPHGVVGRNRYAAGITPARFIRIAQAYEGRVMNFIVPEFNEWFRYEGMVEILKIAMERGEIKYEFHKEVVGPYRFSSFLSVNYNTKVQKKGYQSTIRDPNFQAIEDRMVCRLHRLTKERFLELAESQRRLALGEADFGEISNKIRDHLNLVYAIQTSHPLVSKKFSPRPILLTKEFYDRLGKVRNLILDSLDGESVPFSARLEDRTLRLAGALSLVAFFQSKDRFLEVDSDSMFQALSFYVEEAAVRSNESFEPSEILQKIRMA